MPSRIQTKPISRMIFSDVGRSCGWEKDFVCEAFEWYDSDDDSGYVFMAFHCIILLPSIIYLSTTIRYGIADTT